MIDRIHAEKDYFRVEKIAYTARGDMQYLDLNCHRTIPSHYIAEGLQEALDGIELRQNLGTFGYCRIFADGISQVFERSDSFTCDDVGTGEV